ncbi:MAG: hypothetical protein EBU08_11290 [Micrococcales bacterium]|nr:hypothetical protein [Micrococcales bacterium]
MIVVMQIWNGDKELSVSTVRDVRAAYPDCKIGILANNCSHPKELEDYADLIHTTSEDVYHEHSGGLAIHELLVLGLRLPGNVIVKIDPNTSVSFQHGVEEEISERGGVIGQLTMIREDLLFVSSGVFAISRGVARQIVDSCILLDSSIQNPESGSQSLLRRYFATKEGLSSHDWPIAYASSILEIPHHYSGKLLKAFRHKPREPVSAMMMKKTNQEESSGLVAPPNISDLRSEILAESPEHTGLNKAIEFISTIWGADGISISMKQNPDDRMYIGNAIDADGVLHHSAPKYGDIAEAKKALKEGVFSFKIMNAKPENGVGVSMVVLDVDRPVPANCQASVVSTSYTHSQIFMLMDQNITEEQALALIKEADFSDKGGSKATTMLVGVRIPGSASYEEICLHNTTENRCTAHKVLADGKVRLVKYVDKFFTYDEALAVIRGLAESYKVRPPVMEPEPALP